MWINFYCLSSYHIKYNSKRFLNPYLTSCFHLHNTDFLLLFHLFLSSVTMFYKFFSVQFFCVLSIHIFSIETFVNSCKDKFILQTNGVVRNTSCISSWEKGRFGVKWTICFITRLPRQLRGKERELEGGDWRLKKVNFDVYV
jgi:hypothetical protein